VVNARYDAMTKSRCFGKGGAYCVHGWWIHHIHKKHAHRRSAAFQFRDLSMAAKSLRIRGSQKCLDAFPRDQEMVVTGDKASVQMEGPPFGKSHGNHR
jgi:hypothetical protein